MDTPTAETSTGSGSEQEFSAGVRLVVLNLPEDEGEGLGFRLTRTLWDPYPWVRDVIAGARADAAGLKKGDCLLQADGKDLLGLPVGQVASFIRGDGAGRGVSLLVWNCGVDPKDDPELLWSCGGGSRGERSRRALSGVVKALSCCVCAATATKALNCARSHLYCEGCWKRLERCALCRETLPAKDSPYARNLVAEQMQVSSQLSMIKEVDIILAEPLLTEPQGSAEHTLCMALRGSDLPSFHVILSDDKVFEAIAIEYEIKDTAKRTESISAYNTPNRSPNMSPASIRKGQYQLSMMNRKLKTVQFSDKFGQNYASDPNIHRSLNNQEVLRRTQPQITIPTTTVQIQSTGNTDNGGKSCKCQSASKSIPKIEIEDTDNANKSNDARQCCQNLIQHKLVARLRQACSLADLQNVVPNCPCPVTGSLNNISSSEHCKEKCHSSSLDNLRSSCASISESTPVYVVSAPPIYLLTCDHGRNKS